MRLCVPSILLLGKRLGSWARGCQIVRRTWEPPVTLDTQRWRELAAVLLSLKIRNLNEVEEVLDQNISEGLLTRSDEGDSGTQPRDVHAATLSPGVWSGRGKGRPSQGGRHGGGERPQREQGTGRKASRAGPGDLASELSPVWGLGLPARLVPQPVGQRRTVPGSAHALSVAGCVTDDGRPGVRRRPAACVHGPAGLAWCAALAPGTFGEGVGCRMSLMSKVLGGGAGFPSRPRSPHGPQRGAMEAGGGFPSACWWCSDSCLCCLFSFSGKCWCE